MRDLNTLTFHPIQEKIVKLLCEMVQNDNPNFFRVLLCFHLAKLAGVMRADIATDDRGNIPINMYAINLASSGQGKGHSTAIIEEQILNQFTDVFLNQTFPVIAEENIAKLAVERAGLTGEDPDVEELKLIAEFQSIGELAMTFDSATVPAVKEMRHKLLMGGIGAINLEIDEIGTNMSSFTDILGAFLELYDIGKIKQKLIKNVKDQIRRKEIPGRTPTNLIVYGTPVKLLDGAKTEEMFYNHLETGLGRRCIYGYSLVSMKRKGITAKQIYDMKTDKTAGIYLRQLSARFGALANATNYAKVITMSEAVTIQLIEYQQYCEALAFNMADHQSIAKAEMEHRYFKTLKLAGTYAFIDGHSEITEDNLYHAICMVEESGRAFEAILLREKSYVKLARYIASVPNQVTHVDLGEDLQFYRGSKQQKNELLENAVTWGYLNHIAIKRDLINNIEFISGSSLKETSLDKMILCYSHDISDAYKNKLPAFHTLHKLMQLPDKHWVNHHTSNGNRSMANMVAGFNMVVLDIDGGTTINQAATLFKEYKYLMYTTKRHTAAAQRFRIILPLNYHMEMGDDEYKQFMQNLFAWLPFSVDEQTTDRCRKWLTFNGTYAYSKGDKLLDARLFIPQTAENNRQKQVIESLQSLSNLERWFIQNAGDKGRNNQMLKYALILVDMGQPIDQVREKVKALNSKLAVPMDDGRIESTIMTTATNKIIERAGQ